MPKNPTVDEAANVVAKVIDWCNSKEPKSEVFDLEQAAAYLGYSVDGFRKLVDQARKGNNDLEFCQPTKGGRIMFKREWLDNFVSPTARKPVTPVKANKQRTANPAVDTDDGPCPFGLDLTGEPNR